MRPMGDGASSKTGSCRRNTLRHLGGMLEGILCLSTGGTARWMIGLAGTAARVLQGILECVRLKDVGQRTRRVITRRIQSATSITPARFFNGPARARGESIFDL